jgi:hypothetical protein
MEQVGATRAGSQVVRASEARYAQGSQPSAARRRIQERVIGAVTAPSGLRRMTLVERTTRWPARCPSLGVGRDKAVCVIGHPSRQRRRPFVAVLSDRRGRPLIVAPGVTFPAENRPTLLVPTSSKSLQLDRKCGCSRVGKHLEVGDLHSMITFWHRGIRC